MSFLQHAKCEREARMLMPQKGSDSRSEGVLRRDFREGTEKAETRLSKSTAPFACALLNAVGAFTNPPLSGERGSRAGRDGKPVRRRDPGRDGDPDGQGREKKAVKPGRL